MTNRKASPPSWTVEAGECVEIIPSKPHEVRLPRHQRGCVKLLWLLFHPSDQIASLMDCTGDRPLGPLVDGMFKFLVSSPRTASQGPRLGCLQVPRRPAINSPHYVATTSRGVVPHLSQDVLQKNTGISAAYIALEDCKWFCYHSQRLLTTYTYR